MLHILRTLSQFLWMPAFVIAFIYQRKAINKTKAFSVKHSIDFVPNFLGLPRADEIKHMHMNAKTEDIKKDIEKVMSDIAWMKSYIFLAFLLLLLPILALLKFI